MSRTFRVAWRLGIAGGEARRIADRLQPIDVRPAIAPAFLDCLPFDPAVHSRPQIVGEHPLQG